MMSVRSVVAKQSKAAISVSEMCRMLDISRSQFYWHVERGTFHPPMYLVKNKRPYFTSEIAQENLQARETGIGVDGEFVIFYAKRAPSQSTEPGNGKKSRHAKLMSSLQSLGMTSVTPQQVEEALAACFPNGISGQDETTVLRAVLRQIKRSESR